MDAVAVFWKDVVDLLIAIFLVAIVLHIVTRVDVDIAADVRPE